MATSACAALPNNPVLALYWKWSQINVATHVSLMNRLSATPRSKARDTEPHPRALLRLEPGHRRHICGTRERALQGCGNSPVQVSRACCPNENIYLRGTGMLTTLLRWQRFSVVVSFSFCQLEGLGPLAGTGSNARSSKWERRDTRPRSPRARRTKANACWCSLPWVGKLNWDLRL